MAMIRYKRLGKDAYVPTDEELTGLYTELLGRPPEGTSLNDWKDWARQNPMTAEDFRKSFEDAASKEITGRVSNLGTNLMSGNIPGYDYGLQEKNIESQYETAGKELENILAEKAAGGGFETSGYYTSLTEEMGKLKSTKISTLADLNSRLSEMKVNMSLQGASLLSGLEEKKYTRQQYDEQMAAYNKSMAEYRDALKQQQADWWKPVLGGIAGAWLGPGGIIAGASAGQSQVAKVPTQPTQPSYYSPVSQAIQPVGFGYNPNINKKNYFESAY